MTLGDSGSPDSRPAAMSELPFGDLFALASALADLVGAPVTIEDRETAVLAYSDGQLSVDEVRIATILGRRVPQHYRDALQRAGVFQRIASESGVVYIDLPDSGMKPRAIVGVRAHGELLGSVWAALSGPPTPEQERALVDAAPVVAAHLLHDRSRRDVRRQTRTELVTDLLRGGAEAVVAAERLRLPVGGVVVAALTPTAGVAVNGQRMADALALYLSAVEPHSVSAVVGSTVYCILRADQAAARRIVADFLTRAAERDQVVGGLGRPVPGPGEAHRSRADADAVAQALSVRGRVGSVATIDEVFLDVVTVRIAELLAAEGMGEVGPLPALVRHDAEQGSELVETARAYLAHGGDVRDAAQMLHIHPNTLRNRVRRAHAACGVDLDDADTRLAVMLQLRATDLAGGDGH